MSNKPGKKWLRTFLRKNRIAEAKKRKYRRPQKPLEHRKQCAMIGAIDSGNVNFPEGSSRSRTPTSALSETGRELTNH